MLRIGVTALLLSIAACDSRAVPKAESVPAIPIIDLPTSVAMTARVDESTIAWIAPRRDASDSIGQLVGDSAVRLRLWPSTRVADSAMSRVCGALATGRVPTALADARVLPIDSSAPALGIRRLKANDVAGVRWIVPGTQAQYAFEGLTDNGQQRVSFRWPVRADTSVRIPVGAADSVIEAALSPSPDTLDAFMRRVVASSGGMPTPAANQLPKPRQADAVPLVSDLPFHLVTLSRACPTTTLRLNVLARTDQRIRIPVRAGDQIDAFASTQYGAVQVSIEEVGPTAPPTGFANVPEARAIATVDGTLTLRLTLQVVSKQQRADQDVLVRVTRRGARAAP